MNERRKYNLHVYSIIQSISKERKSLKSAKCRISTVKFVTKNIKLDITKSTMLPPVTRESLRTTRDIYLKMRNKWYNHTDREFEHYYGSIPKLKAWKQTTRTLCGHKNFERWTVLWKLYTLVNPETAGFRNKHFTTQMYPQIYMENHAGSLHLH
jgi:hypothetical protein